MPRFKVDENLPSEVAQILIANGHDAHTVAQEQLTGRPDADVERTCALEKRALLTLDLDFADIRNYPPDQSQGIVVLRLSTLDKLRVLQCVRRLAPLLDQESLPGKLWIVDEYRVRIRS